MTLVVLLKLLKWKDPIILDISKEIGQFLKTWKKRIEMNQNESNQND